ncbi:hypothetical protein EC968_006056 [Mortierella alpina]|nr:hypothetical protein EC968_006056 [Mortierella alpina]
MSTASSAESTPSTLSTKERRQQQLQLLQRQQLELYKQQKQQQFDRYGQGQAFGNSLGYAAQGGGEQVQGQRQVPEQEQEQHLGQGLWGSQEMKDPWITVGKDIEVGRLSAHFERRNSHLSDRHMNVGSMKLLSDETPPDDIWSMDDIEDDHATTTTPTPHHNERNDSNITKNNNDDNSHTRHDNHTNKNNDDGSRSNSPTRGYVNMGKDLMSRAPHSGLWAAMSKPRNNPNRHARDGQVDFVNDEERSSPRITHIQEDFPASQPRGDNQKFPWRDSKLDDLFTDIHDSPVPYVEQLEGSDLTKTKAGSGDRHDDYDSEADTASSLSFGDIMDAIYKGHESIDHATGVALPLSTSRQSKHEMARQRLAELTPYDDDLHDSPPEIHGPKDDSTTRRPLQSDHDALRKQREAVIDAAARIDPNDDRSLRSPQDSGQGDHLKIRVPTLAPGKLQPNIPSSARSSRYSYGSRHRSQGSKDTEMGDRGSTTSRDSVYRDSLSGSTLGSAGFQAQFEGINKHELANVFVALKEGAVAELTANSNAHLKQNTVRILPRDVNSSPRPPADKLEGDPTEFSTTAPVDIILTEDTDVTPKPGGRTGKPRMLKSAALQRARINPENDAARAKQYAALANKGLSKQSSSFVEEMANATDTALKSTTDISFKSTISAAPSSGHKEEIAAMEKRLAGDFTKPQVSEPRTKQQEAAKPREVKFDAARGTPSFDNNDASELGADMDDLGSLAGSPGMENAFKSLEILDMSFDVEVRGDDRSLSKTSKTVRRRHADDDDTNKYLSLVTLPSIPQRRGEYSLNWEDQIETASNTNSLHFGGDSTRSRSSSKSGHHHASSDLAPEESSFSYAKGHLMRYLTGLHPFDGWDHIKTLDLTKKDVESTISLDELARNIEVLVLDENQISYLTGVPKSVKTLRVRFNKLSDLTNFSHLVNLQYLDISHNGIEDLTGLSSLVHLRELIAQSNNIKSVSALQQMDGLIRLDVSHNCLTGLDFRRSQLQRLEFLDASYNKIEQLENLESLEGLIHANLAHNRIEDISLVQPLRRLRILRLSENKLVTFDAVHFPRLRTLYLDDNRLQALENCQTLTRLENFSARDQEGEGIAINMTEFVNSRKLYLSGNPIHALDFDTGFYRLEYLEICAGCLTELPLDFAILFPNLRGLNLSYNGLDSLAALDGLHRLRRLIFVGNNLKRFNDVFSLLKRMRSLVTLDLRHNPLTSNMYPAMSIRQGSKYQDTYRTNQNSETELDWRRRDVGFRRSLPDTMYVKRSVYRAAILKSCKRLEWFDGGAIQSRERERVPMVLGDLVDNYGRNYLMDNRRQDEDEEEDEFEYGYDAQGGYYYHAEGLAHGEEEEGGADWVFDRQQLEQDEDAEGRDDDFEQDDRDPEDITDHSKRVDSSVGSGSLNGQHYVPKSPLSRLSSMAPRRMRSLSSSGYPMASPTMRGIHQQVASSPSKTNLTAGASKRMSSSSTLSQSLLIKSGRSSSSQPRRRHQEELAADPVHEIDHEEALLPYEGSSDKRSAVRSWRDEVNEVSQQRKLQQSPRVVGASSATRSRPPSAAAVVHETRLQSRQVPLRKERSTATGSSKSASSGSSRSSVRNETSTVAVANNSGEKRRSAAAPLERRTSVGRNKVSIPPPLMGFAAAPSAQPLMHVRGRSDGTTSALLQRPRSQQLHSTASGFEGGASPMHHSMHQSTTLQRHMSMSPSMGLTASGTLLRPSHLRRRSFGLYPVGHSPSHHHVGPSPAASPGYFSMNHHQSQQYLHQTTQSPFGFGKSVTPSAGLGGGGRSLPNTPSKGGRASRVSIGQGTQHQQLHYPQTLARDMERSVTED